MKSAIKSFVGFSLCKNPLQICNRYREINKNSIQCTLLSFHLIRGSLYIDVTMATG